MAESIDDELEERDMAAVTKAAAELMTQFDAVQIFATRHESGGTVRATAGLGNRFARLGMVRVWLKLEELDDIRGADDEK